MEEMGMTDKQFNGFLRFLLKSLKDIRDEKDIETKDKKIVSVIEDLQKTLED